MALTGYYTTQAAAEAQFGVFNIAIWSNRDNTIAPNADGSPNIDPVIVQDALNRIDDFVNRMARLHGYTAPVVTTIADWRYLSDLCATGVGILLYTARGIQDPKSSPSMVAMQADIFGGHTNKGVTIPGQIERMFIDGIAGATRATDGLSVAPMVVLSPVIIPYGGTGGDLLPGSTIPTVP